MSNPETRPGPHPSPEQNKKNEKRRIVLCFDGTWNKPTKQNGTNVEHISNALVYDDNQEVRYFRGVGAREGKIDYALGGISGYGISSNIKDAYEYIVEHYKAGADIYLFGFSRGAYTARSLSGFLHLVGVIDDDKREEYKSKYGTNIIDDAYDYYRLPEEKSGNYITRKLQQYSFGATTRDEFIMKDKLNGEEKTFKSLLEDAKDPDRRSIRVEFLGVWDTVGSLGAPPVPGIRAINAPWVSFHDTKLSPNVKYAYQAVALHELRKNYVPVFWTEKNEKSHTQIVEQAWFPGAHSNVGGGYEQRGLSDLSLQWMIEQAKGIRLTFKDTADKIQGDETEQIETSRLDFPWYLSSAVVREMPHPKNVEENISDCIYADPSVRERLKHGKTHREKLLYHREPYFEKVDKASKNIPTRDERLAEILKRREAEGIKQLLDEINRIKNAGGSVEIINGVVYVNGLSLPRRR